MNLQLYHLKATLANTCDRWWPHIQHTTEEKLHQEIKSNYKTLDKKLQNLTLTQKETPFSNRVMGLLHKGLKYKIHTKKKDWIHTLALEAETAITQLPTKEREVHRKLIPERLDKLQKPNPTHNTRPEAKLLHSIQRKLKEHDVMITRADKGNTVVILPTHQYETKLQDFIQNNNFHAKTTDSTKTFQTQVRTTIKQSPTPPKTTGENTSV